MQRQFDTNQIPLNVIIQQVNKNIVNCPEIFAKIIKESTNFLSQELENRKNCMKIELFQVIDDIMKTEVSSFKEYCMETNYDSLNYLSELKSAIEKIETSLDGDTNSTKNVKDKIDRMKQSMLKTDEKLEENFALVDKLTKMQNFKEIEKKNKKEPLKGFAPSPGSDSNDDSKLFHTAVDENEFNFSAQTNHSNISIIEKNKNESYMLKTPFVKGNRLEGDL